MDCSVPSRILYLLLISLISAANSHNNTSNQNPRIINGSIQRTPLGYVVSVQVLEGNAYTNLGGGAIISEDFVLTAAHIIDRLDSSRLSIQAGVTDLSDTGSRQDVLGYKVHEEYEGMFPFENDIAIIKVTPSFVLDGVYITPINYISTTVVDGGNIAVMSGWGRTSSLGLTNSIFSNPNIMRSIRVTTVSQTVCYNIYEIPSTNICTEASYGGACRGDGGGPVTNAAGTLLIGIMSTGPTLCASFGFPDIHTRISEYNDWITAKMTETYP